MNTECQERRKAARDLLAALTHMQAAFAGKSKADYTDYQWKAFAAATAAISAARDAGVAGY